MSFDRELVRLIAEAEETCRESLAFQTFKLLESLARERQERASPRSVPCWLCGYRVQYPAVFCEACYADGLATQFMEWEAGRKERERKWAEAGQ